MGEGSKIGWTDHTFNPWWGCARVSKGCEHCYAETFAKRTGHDVWGKGGERRFFGDAHWAEPLKWDRKAAEAGVRARVFCASMADVFEDHPALPPHRDRLWELIDTTPNLDWLLLTKRPENMAGMSPCAGEWPRNIWAGTTVEEQDAAEKRVLWLLEAPAAVRFLSCEPLLGAVDLTNIEVVAPKPPYGPGVWLNALTGHAKGPDDVLPARIDWVIAGGESGGGARLMHPDWARSLRDQCVEAGTAFFFKQWGAWRPLASNECATTRDVEYPGAIEGYAPMARRTKHKDERDLDGRTWDEFPASVVSADA